MLLCLSGSQNSFYMTVRIQWPRRTGLLRELSKTSLSYFYLNYFGLNTALQNILKNLRVKYVLVVFFFILVEKLSWGCIINCWENMQRGFWKKIMIGIKVHIASKCWPKIWGLSIMKNFAYASQLILTTPIQSVRLFCATATHSVNPPYL